MFAFFFFFPLVFFLYWFLVPSTVVLESTLCDLNLVNVLRLVLWLNIWSTLEHTPCTFKKNVYSAVVGWRVLYMFVGSDSFIILFKPLISLLIFCLDSIHYWNWCIEVSNYYCRAIYSALQFFQCVLHIFWGSVVLCMYVTMIFY